ncbi:MAG: LemA family protein [Patescibacteria group bacterium]|nr:LemA family protein [Patescibacteria group bacterium]
MKKLLIAIIIVLVLVGGWAATTYNGLVQAEVTVDEQWAQVETDYQRRADLVPQLVSTVRGAADFEKTTLENVTNARTQWLNASSVADKVQAGDALGSAIARLLVTVENYPNIKATENFLVLQSELEGTENRISVSRKRFNEAVSLYNQMTRVMPKSLVAKLFGFEAKDFFMAEEGAEEAVEVEFNF